jgi:chemotaxis protein CheC
MKSIQPKHLALIMHSATQRAAEALEEILEQPVRIDLEDVRAESFRSIEDFFKKKPFAVNAGVKLQFSGAFWGSALFLLAAGQEQALFSELSKHDPVVVDSKDAQKAILAEIGNIILNACVGTIVNELNERVNYQVPEVFMALLADNGSLMDSRTGNQQEAETFVLTSQLMVGALEVNAYIVVFLCCEK